MSYSAMRPDGVAVHPAVMAAPGERLAFIQKVYGLMFSAVLVFALTAGGLAWGLMSGVPVLREIGALAVGIHPLLAFLLLLGASFGAHALSMVKGLNVLALYGFAAVFGFLSVSLMVYAQMVGGAAIFIQAAGLTILVFGGLTAFVFLSRKDFSFIGGFLMVGLLTLIGATLIAIVMSMLGFEVQLIHVALSIAAVLLFAGYTVYDTSNLIHRYSVDMVVPAALALTIDFIMLFRNILYLMAVSRD